MRIFNKSLKLIKLVVLLLFTQALTAGEGMWLPLLLESLNEDEMKNMGLKLSAEDIYSVNKSSLKDAIVHFGGFCTAEVISNKGLLLTNHHCGYGQIQSHTTLENNYLRDGFWAMKKEEELANPGLFARFILRMEDVSDDMLAGVTDDMDSQKRQSIIDKNMEMVRAKYEQDLPAYDDIVIRPFYHGNEYYMFVTRTFNDVRLVGAPPESVGKYGSDTDNWVWPRHTGDFAMFRIYAGPDNLPADYSPDNKPYVPKHSLPISVDGVEEGDFTMVFGFPGRTTSYLPASAVKQTVEVLNPAKINIRETALDIIDKYMRVDPQVKIQYASKFARVANYWKKWIGESQGIEATDGIGKKLEMEKEFLSRLNKSPELKSKYGNLLSDFEKLYKDIEPYAKSRDYYNEVVFRNVEILRAVSLSDRLVSALENNGEEGYKNMKQRLTSGFYNGFYKDYRPEIDQEVCAALMELYKKNVPFKGLTSPLDKMTNTRDGMGDYTSMAKKLYGSSFFTSESDFEEVMGLAPKDAVAKIKADPLYTFMEGMKAQYSEIVEGKYNTYNDQITEKQRLYMKALMEVFPEKRMYPDANSTMRITYGKVNGYHPRDAVYYTPVTYLDGAMAKYKPGDYEFDMPAKLIELYEKKDYGRYAADNGKMPICFIGTNHTTGGNSGSPAIDANGNLIGLNFDRAWEGTMSDINYDPSICRNIMVDARYILFIVDKFAGATHLTYEMNLVTPKKMANATHTPPIIDKGKRKKGKSKIKVKGPDPKQ